MKMIEKPSYWIFCFTIIFFLSLDYWHWKQENSLFILTLPSWIFYFIGLQIIFVGALALFAIKAWK